MTDRKGDWMHTFSGRKFWPLDPRPEDVHLEDVTHHLAMKCRFNGACLRFYSVAEHSVLLARNVLDSLSDISKLRVMSRPQVENLALWLLLHDGSEAYLPDVIRPIKPHLQGYREIDDGVQRAVYVRFGLNPIDQPRLVSLLDSRILNDEYEQNMHPTDDTWKYVEDQTEPLGVTLQFWTPEQAKSEFLETFKQLFERTP